MSKSGEEDRNKSSSEVRKRTNDGKAGKSVPSTSVERSNAVDPGLPIGMEGKLEPSLKILQTVGV